MAVFEAYNKQWNMVAEFKVKSVRKPAPQGYFDNRIVKNSMFVAGGYKFVFSLQNNRDAMVHVFTKNNRFVTAGFAFLHHGDTFDAEVGCKLVLTDALQAMNLSREERREIWAKYFERTKGE